nr:GAF domain-containing protein [Anaerolineae bacterium]
SFFLMESFKVSTPENTTRSGALRELQQARSVLDEVLASLEAQKTILKQRGMSLPPLVTTTLTGMQHDLRSMENLLVNDVTELGQLRALAEVSAKITTTLQVDTVLEQAMDIVIALTRAERGYIILVNKDTGDLEFRVVREDALNPRAATSRPQVSQTILKHVATTRQALLADNAFQDDRLQQKESIASLALRSVLCVPLLYKDDFIGVVYVDNRWQSGVFQEREKNLLLAFANTAAVAIANAFLYEDIQNLLAEITQVKVLMDNVFSSVGSGIVATDADDVVQTFNRAAERILSRSAAQTVGKDLGAVLPRITADLGDYLDSVRQKSEPALVEGELQVQDRRVAISMKLSPLKDLEDVTQGVAVVLDDVTSQIENAQQLRVIKNYLPPELVDSIHTISRLALGGERREVTCMFVEVRPLSSFKDIPPREVMDLLNTFLGVATGCIYATRGVIDKYMGNEVMALYNTQLNPMPDHARHAVDCALQMREGFVALYRQLGIQPQPHYYRLGIHTGICTLGNVGSLTRRDFTAIGDTINLAKRLEENAAAGQIIISENTRASLEALPAGPPAITLTERSPIQVKGRTQQTRIFEVFRA